MNARTIIPWVMLFLCFVGESGLAQESPRATLEKNISVLNHHFNNPGGDISPWMFIPDENIKEVSTAEAPGLVTIWQKGNGKDIKGILKEPIRIDDYPLPWRYELGLVQNWNVLYGFGSKSQVNAAIGINVAVTFSDPSTWPKDRSQRPPETHDFQLLAVHLGSSGELSPGLPQFSTHMHPERFFLFGRGDLDHNVVGDWEINPMDAGTVRDGGPAAQEIYFSCTVSSPQALQVGFRWQQKFPSISRQIDCSRFGEITGIWEIGPIFSCDRWIPDVLCRHLPKTRKKFFAGSKEPDIYVPKIVQVSSPEPEAPDPYHEFYVDYCTFFGPELEQASDDFNIPGYLANWQFQLPYAAETWSHPGFLTVTHLGASQWSGFNPQTITSIDLKKDRPPLEIEVCMIPPDNSIPWNFYFIAGIRDAFGKNVGAWYPGVQNFPAEGRARYFNYATENSIWKVKHKDWYQFRNLPRENLFRSLFDVQFDTEVPNEILTHKPLFMLLQVIDPTHVRIGFKAKSEDPWFLSEIYDCSEVTNGGISKIGVLTFSSGLGRHYGMLSGSPMYQQFLYDYIHYRHGLSVEP